jgi:hypothetical protein
MQIPPALLDRIDEQARKDLFQLPARLNDAYSTQYAIERRTFSPLEHDDGYTFAVGVNRRGFGRASANVEDLPSVASHRSGFKQSFTIGPLTVRPYRFGSQQPADIHLERLDAGSLLKQFVSLDNSDRVQLAFDLRAAVNAPPVELSTCSSNQLVLALYGNPREGRTGIYLGAPLSELTNGSYWEWVVELDAPGDVDDLAQPQEPAPDGPTPYDGGPEPVLQLRKRVKHNRSDGS